MVIDSPGMVVSQVVTKAVDGSTATNSRSVTWPCAVAATPTASNATIAAIRQDMTDVDLILCVDFIYPSPAWMVTVTVSLEARRSSDTVTSNVMAVLFVTDGATKDRNSVSAPDSVTSCPAVWFHEYVMVWPSGP